MADLLAALINRAGRYVGRGVNHEQESFEGALRVEPLVDGTAVMLTYIATRDDGIEVHAESTLLARAPDGRLCLWPVMRELPFVIAHPAVAGDDQSTTFSSGARDAVSEFREEITLALAENDGLVYSHAWGLPGGEFKQRSQCELRRVQG